MRADEEFAQRAFAEFLDRTGAGEVAWAAGDEPPDRYLTIDGGRFAVEITQIMELVPLGTHSMPDHGVNEALRRFAVSLANEAEQRGVLKGTYVIYLEPIPNFATHREALSDRVFHYLESTAARDSADAAVIGAFERKAISRAQLTKSGFVYMISNIGAFGERVCKLGMTQRLEPMDRIHELGGAAVPFPFALHAMLYSDDAPALEHALHQHLTERRVNLVNARREYYFDVNLEEVESFVRGQGLSAQFTKMAEAKEYRQSLALRAAQDAGGRPTPEASGMFPADPFADEDSPTPAGSKIVDTTPEVQGAPASQGDAKDVGEGR